MDKIKITPNIIRIDYATSTNDYARSLIRRNHPPSLTAIFTNEQTAGRGQKNNKWHSEPGKNLTCSIIIYPTFLPPDKQFAVNEALCLAITDMLGEIAAGFSIKWPNDIYFQGKKIAGILVENALLGNSIEYAVLGIGLNINQKFFPANLSNPISLTQITGKQYDIRLILDQLLGFFKNRYHQLYSHDYKGLEKIYHKRLYLKDQYHVFQAGGRSFKGCIQGVDKYGRLRVINNVTGKENLYYFKEIEF